MIRYCLKPSSWIWGMYQTVHAENGKVANWLCLGPIAICLRYR